MPSEPTLLRALLKLNHWQTYQTFCTEYDRAAGTIDSTLKRTWPSRAQLHRWGSGQLVGLPYPHHCRVLEVMFPEWRADQLFALPPSGLAPVQRNVNGSATMRSNRTPSEADQEGRRVDASSAYATRSEFLSHYPPHSLFDQAHTVRAVGLSLNLVCQQYPEQCLRHLVETGSEVHCLFLDPAGEAIKRREEEEGYTPGHLSGLTDLNIQTLKRARSRMSADARERMLIGTYDETVRFNIFIVDGSLCVMQPYLPAARGVDSPTFVLQRGSNGDGLFATFEQVMMSLWERGTPT